MPQDAHDKSAQPRPDPIPAEGTITIRWKRLPDRYREEGRDFAWNYQPEPPIPDELAERLLREVADRL
jgi:hypothetical protein